MNSNYNMPNYQSMNNYANNMKYPNNNDDRLVGPIFPFLLGGVTGAAIAPAFWRPSPYYRPYPYPYYPYPPYYR